MKSKADAPQQPTIHNQNQEITDLANIEEPLVEQIVLEINDELLHPGELIFLENDDI